ncbi:MAG: hypothetical protein ACO3QA_02325 [Phycisphaerales bacterium]
MPSIVGHWTPPRISVSFVAAPGTTPGDVSGGVDRWSVSNGDAGGVSADADEDRGAIRLDSRVVLVSGMMGARSVNRHAVGTAAIHRRENTTSKAGGL